MVIVVYGLASQTKAVPPDSLAQKQQERHYTMPEFVVSATRWQVNVQQLPSSATVLTSADLLGTNGNTLGSALEGVPGLFLKSYGGPGSVSTTSMRGMGAEHTLVLVDGQRYNNVRDGQVDFGIFLLQNIDRVEVLRGGFSSLYGADAIGGIINIITRRSGSKPSLEAEVAAGSYGMNGFQVSSDFSLRGIGLQVAAQREVGGGNFEFKFNDGISSNILLRQNSDYTLNQVQLRADVPLLPGLSMRVSSMVDWSERGSPGAVLAQTSGNKARLRDNGILTQATVEWTIQPTLLVRLSSLFHAQRREYRDPLASGGIDDGEAVYSDRTVTVTPHLRHVLSSSSSVNLGAEYSHSSISGNEVAGADRNQESLFLSSDHVVEFSRALFYQINVYPSIRYDHFSDVPGVVNPKLGINLGLVRSEGIRLKASYGKSFRAPTFNDLYWKSGGNPALRPERSLSFDAGLVFSSNLFGPLEFEASYFDIRTIDRIVWSPDRSGLWTPKNLQNVQSSGIELIAAWRLLDDHVLLRASYSNSDTRKTGSGSLDDQTLNRQLPYIPNEIAGVSCALNLGRATIRVHHTFTGFRFSTETNDPRFILAGYSKTNANVAVRLTEQPLGADLRFEVSNLFNSNYQLFPNFPMPLRTFALKVLFDY